MSDTGWGGKFWGASNWGDLGDEFVNASSVSASYTINSVTVGGNATVVVSGLSLQTVIQETVAGASADVVPTGLLITNTIGNSEGAPLTPVVGSSLAPATGQVTIDDQFLIGAGWGRDAWGSMAWGDAYSVQLQGISLSVVTGNEDAFTDVVVAVSGIELSADITPVGTSATSDTEIAHSFLLENNLGSVSLTGTGFVSLTGISLSTAIGDAEAGLKTEVPVTGVSLQTAIGNEDITGDGLVELTGIGATLSVGNSTTISGYDVSGISATYATPGNVIVTGGATVVPTGIGLTVTAANPNIIAWAEVDVGTEVTWTPVDLAA